MKNTLPLIWITFLLAFPSKQEFSEAFIKVASNGNPAVVSIVSEKVIEQHYNQFFSPFGDQFPQGESRGHSLGSGVIIDSDEGYIITNNHVIDDAEDIKVILYDKREVKGTIVATDPPSDLAVIKVDPNGLATVALGNSDQLSAGEWVVAIGSPFGLHLNHTVTAGIVSAVGRSSVMSRNNFEDFIQHDAAINPGNSGGALFNLDGELVGINTAIATDGFSRANAGVGFAIPINMVKRVMEDLISDGNVRDLARRLQALRKERGYNPTEILDAAYISGLDSIWLDSISSKLDVLTYLVRVKETKIMDQPIGSVQWIDAEIDGKPIKISVE